MKFLVGLLNPFFKQHDLANESGSVKTNEASTQVTTAKQNLITKREILEIFVDTSLNENNKLLNLLSSNELPSHSNDYLSVVIVSRETVHTSDDYFTNGIKFNFENEGIRHVIPPITMSRLC